MGAKRVIDTYQSVTDGDMSSDITSPSTNILYTDRVGFQLSWTGTPTGTFSVEISNDEISWVALTLSESIAAAGSADQAFIDCETAAKFIRLKYTAGSSTGVLQAKLTAKSISG